MAQPKLPSQSEVIDNSVDQDLVLCWTLTQDMGRLTDSYEIEDCLRHLVRELIIRLPSSFSMIQIFTRILMEVGIRGPYALSTSFQSITERNQYIFEWESRWKTCLYSLALSSYIRRETIDLNGCTRVMGRREDDSNRLYGSWYTCRSRSLFY